MVRIAVTRTTDLIEAGPETEPCSLGGLLGPEVALIPKVCGFNCSVSMEKASQQGVDGNYTGDLGSLQRGTADFTTRPVRLPLAGDPVYHGSVMAGDAVSFATVYARPQQPQGDNDLLMTIQFDRFTSASVLCLIAVLFMMMKLHRQRDAIFKIVQSVLQSVKSNDGTISVRLLYWIMATGFFVINVYLSNYILTDLVRQNRPDVLQNFYDVLRPDVDIVFTQDFPIYDMMKQSAIKKVRAIVDKADAMPGGKVIMGQGLDAMEKFIEPKGPLFASFSTNRLLLSSRAVTCIIMKLKNDVGTQGLSVWVPKDSPYQVILTTVYNHKMEPDVKRVLDLATLRQFEHDIYGDKFYDRMMEVTR
ncbi:hypothetical protein HDE_06478 [Halotydeus destructor]|nr:hypothetical protein HDE_06478 [Halotydeus destructor]